MGLLSFLGRKSASGAASSADSADEVHRARIRARRRLIGAVVLVGIGIVAFPLLFETQPRPIPVDIPITIPDRDSAPALPFPADATRPGAAPAAADPASGVAPGAAASEAAAPDEPAGREAEAAASLRQATPPGAPTSAARAPSAEAPAPASSPSTRSAPPERVDRARSAREAAAPPARETTAPVREKPAPERSRTAPSAEAARAQALLEGRDGSGGRVAKDPAAARFVVQIGAYTEASSARDMRQKVEKLGQRTYTQVVKTGSGQRIRVRVGPFDSREEAERAAGRIRAAGLPAAVMTP